MHSPSLSDDRLSAVLIETSAFYSLVSRCESFDAIVGQIIYKPFTQFLIKNIAGPVNAFI
jgi:hypothetical protein